MPVRSRRKKRAAVARALTRGGYPRSAGDKSGPEPDTTGSTADFLRSVDRPAAGHEDSYEAPLAEVEVLEENWNVVDVFRRCQQTWVGAGMGGAYAAGLSSQEIAAAASLAGLELQGDEALFVTQMGSIAAEVLNSRKK